MLLMFLSVSCVLEEPDVTEFESDDIEVIKAKAWFDSKNFGDQNGYSKAARASNDQSRYNDKRPDWSQVKKHTNAEGEKVIEVSLDFEKSLMPKHIIDMYRAKKPSPHQIAQNLLLIEREDGTFRALVLKIYAESDLSTTNKNAFFNQVNYGRTPANFTGEMIMTDMKENIIRGWRIQNGKIISRFKPVVETKKKKGTENQSITCNFEEVDYCEVTSGWFIDPIEGLQYGAELHCYKNNVVVCIKTDADGDNGGGSPISDDPGSGGGGNDGDGGGGDSNCFKQDPYFEDLWIPCDLKEDEPKKMNCTELKNDHNEPKNDIIIFMNSNRGKTYSDIISQRENRSWTFLNSQQGGPSIRYISDPLNPNIIIDLRHLLIVGKLGRIIGESIEIMQVVSENPSGYDDQDFYSNELGYSFFKYYGEAIKHNPSATADYLASFLYDQKYRNSISTPDRCKF